MGVDHGGFDAAVTEELLDGSDVGAGFEEVGGEGVAEGVASDSLGELGGGGGGADGALSDGLVEVVTAVALGRFVPVGSGGGEEPLPGELAFGAWILSAKGGGEFYVAGALG